LVNIVSSLDFWRKGETEQLAQQLKFQKRWLSGTTIRFSEKKSIDNQQLKKVVGKEEYNIFRCYGQV